MLIGLSPLLGPELLATLRAMGHGDELALVDGNYPAQDHARRLIRADGVALLPLLEAILPILPLDDFTPEAIFRSSEGGDPAQRAPVHDRIEAACARLKPGLAVIPLSGGDFYARVQGAHTVVATSEPVLYANVVLRKGVIRP